MRNKQYCASLRDQCLHFPMLSYCGDNLLSRFSDPGDKRNRHKTKQNTIATGREKFLPPPFTTHVFYVRTLKASKWNRNKEQTDRALWCTLFESRSPPPLHEQLKHKCCSSPVCSFKIFCPAALVKSLTFQIFHRQGIARGIC